MKNNKVTRVIRDGKVAVLYSPGFGAGWYTWNTDLGESIIFDPELVAAVESGINPAPIASRKYPSAYTGGCDELTIAWIPIGTYFRIDEYDGSESIEIFSRKGFIKA